MLRRVAAMAVRQLAVHTRPTSGRLEELLGGPDARRNYRRNGMLLQHVVQLVFCRVLKQGLAGIEQST